MEIALPQIKLGPTIGSGTFGKVKSGVHLPSNQCVAVKILNKQKIITKKDRMRIDRQINILKKVNHPNILRLYQVVQSSKSFYLVTNLIQGQQLYQKINRTGGLSQEEAGLYFVQLLDAILCLNKLGIAHRDIKPQNIIINASKLTLIDFGLGNFYQKNEKLHTSCGSPCYAAPQMMDSTSYDPQKTQVWALGVTLYAMISGRLPFQHDNNSGLYKLMMNNKYEQIDETSPELKNIIRGMIESKSNLRLNLKQIKQHKWIKSMRYQFSCDLPSDIKWNSILLKHMSNNLNQQLQSLKQKIIKGFGKQSTYYYLKQQQPNNQYPLHYGPVHISFIFTKIEQAKLFLQNRKGQIRKLGKNIYYVYIEKN